MKKIISNILVTLLLALFVYGVFVLSDTGLFFSSPGQHSENTLKSPEMPEPLEGPFSVTEEAQDIVQESGEVSEGASGEEESKEGADTIPEEETEEVTIEDILEQTQVTFENTLFIGDSRAEGIAEYAGIEGATFYTASGMSVYNIHKQRRINSLNRRTDLATILAERQYDRIYVILGINELGYDYDITQERYTELVEELEAAQPQAMIILNANLHVTANRAQRDVHYNNESIDRMNQGIAEIALQHGHFYLDVNPVFDDENGALGEEYTLDDTHVLAKYYPMWKEFLIEETRMILAQQALSELSEEEK